MLNDAKIKAAKPQERPYKLTDSAQLYLHVSSAGGKSWRMNYTYGVNSAGNPRQKTLTLGTYPSTSLLDARAARDAAKALLRDGRDPAVQKRVSIKANVAASENTFENVARAWHAKRLPRWSKVHAQDVIDSLENDVFPEIGSLPITAIEAPQLLDLLTAIETRGAIETAHRVRSRISSVFVFGIAAGVAKADPAASLGKALTPKPPSKRQPAITELAPVRQMLIDCEGERCRAITKFALRFLALTSCRPGELRFAAWAEISGIDFKTGEAPDPFWIIPAARMKGDEERKLEDGGDHIIPLSRQAVDLLLILHRLTGDLPLLFPGERHLHQPISENTIRALLIRAGYHGRHVPHGFRAAFSTIMNERADRAWREQGGNGASPDRPIIDLMLAHVPHNKVESAYNRAAYMPRRRELAQEWADMLVGDMWPPEIHLGQPIRYAATGSGRP